MNVALAWHILIQDAYNGTWGLFGGPQDRSTATIAMPCGFCTNAGIAGNRIGEAYDLLDGNEEILDTLLERAEEAIKEVSAFLRDTSLTLDEIVKGTTAIREAAYPVFLISYYS
jgi:hypothetical protein